MGLPCSPFTFGLVRPDAFLGCVIGSTVKRLVTLWQKLLVSNEAPAKMAKPRYIKYEGK